MLVHTHVYYSNRFQPGTLFPDTFKLDRGELLAVKPAVVLNISPIQDVVGFDTSNVKVLNMVPFEDTIKLEKFGTTVATSVVDSTLDVANSLGYTLMYILMPSNDFDLNKSMSDISTYASYPIVDIELDQAPSFGSINSTFGTYEIPKLSASIEILSTALSYNLVRESHFTVTVI